MWPPTWFMGPVDLDTVDTVELHSEPVVKDPNTKISINNVKKFLTDQAYINGHGWPYYEGKGKQTNFQCETDMCKKQKTPWAAPGQEPFKYPFMLYHH